MKNRTSCYTPKVSKFASNIYINNDIPNFLLDKEHSSKLDLDMTKDQANQHEDYHNSIAHIRTRM